MQFSIRSKQAKEAAESKESNEAVSKEAIFSLHSSDPESTVELHNEALIRLYLQTVFSKRM